MAVSYIFNITVSQTRQYVNWKILDVQAGFRKHRGARDQIAHIH